MSGARADRRIALALGTLATVVLLLASRGQGFTRDEGYYFDAGELYWQWYAEVGTGLVHGRADGLRQPAVDRWWSYNHEHPALMKALFGISWRLFHRCHCPGDPGRHPVAYATPHRTLPLLSEAMAFRLPSFLMAGCLVGLVYLFAARAISRRAGLLASLLALSVPRYFFHAQLACFDAPMATTWLLTIYCYWRSLTERRFAPWAGVALGLALATKHNAFFLPILMGIHYLYAQRASLRSLRFPAIPAAFLWMAVLGPLIDLASWPWMWFHTVERVREYFAFHLQHVHYNFEYLGTNYNNPPYPRSYPFVMTLLTAPVTTMALALIGGATLAWRRARGTAAAGASSGVGALWVLNAVFPPAIIAFTGAPIFGETKHWLPAMPFVALLAGAGAEWLCRLVERRRDEAAPPRTPRWLATALCALFAAPAVLETRRSHPYALSHYNLLAGGPAGGADLGMNRQFWGYAARGVLPWLDAQAPPHAQVYWHDVNQPMLNMNVREGLLRADIGNSGMEEAGVRASSIGLVVHERHFAKYDYWLWDAYGSTRPALVLTDEGVPLVSVYRRATP